MVFLHAAADTVILVAHADRGHFNWCVPVAESVKALGFKVELWTNSMCEAWLPPGCMDRMESAPFGDGRKLNEMVAGYKALVAEGDSEPEGQRSLLGDGFQRFGQLLARLGLPVGDMPELSTGGAEGAAALAARLRRQDVAFVLWEAVWAKHAADAAAAAGRPSLGLIPTYREPYRAAYQQEPIMTLDGEERVRNRKSDILSTAPAQHEAAFVLAKCLQGKATDTAGRRRFGAFLPSKSAEEREAAAVDLDLQAWLDAEGKVTVVSLGSQSVLSGVSEWAETDLLKGCLAASPRVLATSHGRPHDDDPELQRAVAEGRLRVCAWLPQGAVLAHRNTACLVSHCGANSTHEALAYGRAIVPLPFFDDQWYVAQVVEELMGYTAQTGYAPLRKATLRDGAGAAVPLVAAAVKLGLEVPSSTLKKLKDQVRKEDGAGALARHIRAQIRATPKLRKPRFGKVSSIKPEAAGLNLLLKVVKVDEDASGKARAWEVQAGDTSAVVTLRLVTEAHAQICRPGASIRVQNARVLMRDGFVRVIVDKWGVLRAPEIALDFDVRTDKDISAREYELAG